MLNRMKPNPENFGPGVRRLNPHLFDEQDIRVENSGSVAVVERTARNGALAASKEKKPSTGRVLVRITSRRKRLIDPDNISAKGIIDCCRYAGILADDTAEHVCLETRQEKIAKGEREETLIEIFEVTP